jgi:lipooligosaccharide transport system ATP-binding protein
VLTTHYMDEAEQLCDRLVVMNAGRIVAEGSPRDLIAAHATREVVELRFDDGNARDAATLLMQPIGRRVEQLADRVIVYTEDGDDTAASLAALDVHADAVLVRRAGLEDVFLILTGRSLED